MNTNCYVFCIISLLLLGCASTTHNYNFGNLSSEPEPGYSVLLVRTDSGGEILIDGESALFLPGGTQLGRVIVTNGYHKITRPSSEGNNEIELNVNSDETLIRLVCLGGFFKVKYEWHVESVIALSEKYLNYKSGVEGATIQAKNEITDKIETGSSIVVLYISAIDNNMSKSAIDELEYQLVKSNQYKVLDRNALDDIRSEQYLQLTGEISNDTAISLGNMLGAEYVIIGSITSSENAERLALKVLDVETTQIVAISRISF